MNEINNGTCLYRKETNMGEVGGNAFSMTNKLALRLSFVSVSYYPFCQIDMLCYYAYDLSYFCFAFPFFP